MERIDCAVIGAGVIGIAIARALALAGREVVLIERERHFGTVTSSRNSEVIHAGIYYPAGTLKARFCVEGRQRLYDYCAKYSVPHRRCGKLIVATDPDQEEQLDGLAAAAIANGVDDLQHLGREEVARLEPELACSAALLSPSTGIIDSHALMTSMLGEAEAHGALTAYCAGIGRIDPRPDGYALTLAGEDAPSLLAGRLVNAAGLAAPELARTIEGLPPEQLPPQRLAKGNYFALAGRSPFKRLVYPVPEPGGLGIHATLDLAGQVRFGPDVQWTDELDYDVDPARAGAFYGSIRKYWPGLPDGALVPAYCGIRPKLGGPETGFQDFLISGPADHGLPGLVNLFGIESPGLTASLAIADHVEELLR
jgi:L-2-hydroxyglutarate oxidase LhgO